jgi:hypothetical protein
LNSVQSENVAVANAILLSIGWLSTAALFSSLRDRILSCCSEPRILLLSPFSLLVAILALAPAVAGTLDAQAPAGLAASALANSSFRWIQRSTPGFRVYFLADSYPAAHQDSLLGRLPRALSHVESLIQAPELHAPIDLFFIESRAQMTALIGGRATGFAEPSTRTVLLVTNSDWRAFERHEIMHVIAQHAWGPPAPGDDWLNEGLAQAADGRCAGYPNAEVALALAARHGWIPFDTLLTRFRAQPDLRAYLQAAAFVDYLLRRYGATAVAHLWQRGSRSDSQIDGQSLAAIERHWRNHRRPRRPLTAHTIAAVESKGCG